jgi:lipoate-protein ligase A
VTPSNPPTVTLGGQSCPLAWGNLAKVRYSGVPFAVRKMGGLVDLSVMVWACIARKPSPFDTWEDVAEHVTDENCQALVEAVSALFPEPSAEKKSTSESGPSPDSASG